MERALVVANLSRGPIEALFLASSMPIGEMAEALRQHFGAICGVRNLATIEDALRACRPPFAASVYLKGGDHDLGLDSIAMCLAAEFFACAELPQHGGN